MSRERISASFRYWLMIATGLLALAACNPVANQPPVATPPPTPTVELDVGVEPTTPRLDLLPFQPTSTPLPFPPGVATVSAGLSATLVAGLPPTATPDPASGPGVPGIEGVKVVPVPLDTPDPRLWIAFTYGLRGFDPPQDHFVAFYKRDGTTWQEMSRFTLATADYIDPQGVLVAPFGTDDSVWVEVQSGAGAHSGCFDLLRFDGTTLFSELAHCNSSPFAGEIRDLDGNGLPESVVLNQTDNYVFCYACGVRFWQFQVFRYHDEQMQEVQLLTLPESAPAELRDLNNRAVELAQAGLWKTARETINQVPTPITNETVAWNERLIRLHADARADQVRDGPYPLLDNIFYGDYAAALDLMRSRSVEAIFGQPTPLVAGTVAEGWEQSLTDWIIQTTAPAIQAEPDLAAAFFLRGWAIHLLDANDPAVLDNLERAVQLAPAEPLFQQSVDYVKTQKGPPPGVPATPEP